MFSSKLGKRVSHVFFALGDLSSFEEYWSHISQYALQMGFALFFYHNKGRSLEEENHRDKVPFSSHHIKGTHDQHSYHC